MAYAQAQANAYSNPTALRAAIEAQAEKGGFIRCVWKRPDMETTTAYMALDMMYAGLVVTAVDPVKGRITLHNGQELSANGYVTKAA